LSRHPFLLVINSSYEKIFLKKTKLWLALKYR